MRVEANFEKDESQHYRSAEVERSIRGREPMPERMVGGPARTLDFFDAKLKL